VAVARRFEFFFDYGSPYSYFADSQVEGLARRTGAALAYRPMLLGGVFKATGNRSPAEQPVANKLKYGALAIGRWARHYDVPFRPNPFFPINTLPLMRMCVAAQRTGVFEAFHRAVYPAFWAEALNLGDPEVVTRVLERAGVDAKALSDAFGAPTFFVGDEMFFGADHLMFVEKALSSPPR
jgi:2-hydroxychromene-2-carboxylate isomerase